MTMRNLTFAEAREVYKQAAAEVGVPNVLALPPIVTELCATCLRLGIEEFCKANGIDPPRFPGVIQ